MTIQNRLLNNLRVQLPGAVDEAILLEVFNTVDDLCQNWLQITPPNPTSALDSWLSAADWTKYYRLVMHGTLARMQMQAGKPYANQDLGKLNAGAYAAELTQARGEAASGPVSTVFERLMDTLRVRLPGARDAVMHVEMFNAIDEICRTTMANRRAINVAPVVGQTAYPVPPAEGEVLIVYQVTHKSLDLDGTTFDDGVLVIPVAPEPEDVGEPLILDTAVTPSDGGADQPSLWLGAPQWSRFYQAILDGTLFRMHSQIAKPYTSQPNALYHGKRFRSEMAKLTIRAGNEAEADPQSWSFPTHTR